MEGGGRKEGRKEGKKGGSQEPEGRGLRSAQEAIMEDFLEVAACVQSTLHREGVRQ